MIFLRALGTAEIETPVTTLTPSQEVVFAAALYLILENGKRVTRALLATLLWPQVAEPTRSHRLRQTVLQLKKLGVPVEADRHNLRVAQEVRRVDAEALSNAASRETVSPTSLEFLPGYIPQLSESFQDWLDAKRSNAHAIAGKVLVGELEGSRRRGDWLRVEETATKCLVLDPLNESAVLAKAEASAMRGSKSEAVAILDRYISEVGVHQRDLHLPATLLRRRVVERIPDQQALFNAEAPLVGREIELEILANKFREAWNRRGSASLVVGEAGIGKTRLCAELARFAELQGAYVQRTSCRRTDVDRPLSLFVDIVPSLRELPGSLGCDAETLSWLKRLTEFDQRSGELSRDANSEALFQNVRTALFDLFDSVAEEKCLVILIDDVQWLDKPSAAILFRMVQWCSTRPIFFLLNSRPEDESSFYREQNRLNTIHLGPLKSTASRELLHAVALRAGEAAPPEFIEWCVAVAEGNPFFLQELTHHWLETGQRYKVPPSVTKVLNQRISRLSSEALRVLQTSAILSDHATLDRIEAVLGYRPYQLLAAVDELNRAAMLHTPVEAADPGQAHVQPRHDFLASAAVDRLPLTSLSFIHRRSAEVLERESAESTMPTTLLWACANHRHQAGDKKGSLSLRLSCAQHLLDLGLTEDAANRYEDSLGYCTTDEERLTVLSSLSVALQLQGEWERTKATLRTCMQLKSQGVEAETHNDFEVQLFQARHRSGVEFVALLNDILPCVKCRSASARHRVSAAVVALKLASDVGPASILNTIYSEIEPLLTVAGVDSAARLEAEIIYRTMQGANTISPELLNDFAEHTRSLHGEIAYSHALIACASSCRIAYRDAEAAEYIQAALDHALSHKFGARIAVIKLSTVRLHVVASNWAAARLALSDQRMYPVAVDDLNAQAEWDFFEARVVFEEDKIDEALAAISKLKMVPQAVSASRRAAYLALILRVRLVSGDGPLSDIIQELEIVHKVAWELGNQDFEAYSLFLGLTALGEQPRGRELLYEYLQEHRNSRRPLSEGIQSILSSVPPVSSRRQRTRAIAKGKASATA